MRWIPPKIINVTSQLNDIQAQKSDVQANKILWWNFPCSDVEIKNIRKWSSLQKRGMKISYTLIMVEQLRSPLAVDGRYR